MTNSLEKLAEPNDELPATENAAKAGVTPLYACPDHPYVSIVVCTLGHRPTLERCIDSLLAQGCQHSEILLVLNGNSNQAFSHRFRHYPLRLLQEPRRGVCIARNSAIPKSEGEILVFVDDDIVAHSHWLHELLQGFANPSVACTVGRVLPEGLLYSEGPGGEKAYFNEQALTSRTFGPEKGWYRAILRGTVTGFGCNMAFRKSFLEKYALFPEDLGAGSLIGAADENYMFFQVLQHSFCIHYASSAVVTHFFEGDESQQKNRLQEFRAATFAFHLKLLIEEKEYRWETLLNMFAGGRRFLHASIKQGVSLETLELLSPRERLYSYLRGMRIFWRAHRQKVLQERRKGTLRR
ncbi:MAG: glycosyltransferase [Acidobacteria bacterium]|nr:glycosyltransferase [Acidobacteriota bacterium]